MLNSHRVLLRILFRKHCISLLRGVARYNQLHGPWMYYLEGPLMLYEDNPSLPKLVFSRLVNEEQKIDGLITRNPRLDVKHIKKGTPTIIAIHTHEQIKNIPYVLMDHKAVGRMGAEYLIHLGFKHFAFCGFEDMFWAKLRCEGFTDAMRQAGFSPFIYEAKSKPASWSKMLDSLKEWAFTLPLPIGIMTSNDDRAIHLIEACHEAGLHIPDDIAVLGVSNEDFFCDLAFPPLSSLVLKVEEAGYQTAQLMERLMGGEKMDGQRIIIKPSHIITRQSTDILAVEDRELRTALRFIRDNARLAIQVEDVVKATSLSRRVLEHRFQKQLNSTILEEINKNRVAQIEMFLRETDMSIDHISGYLGFSNRNNFTRFFTRETGITPKVFKIMEQKNGFGSSNTGKET
ncbi:MAG: DNA-binding transcriptional regulator [Sedimentisphaerales bacterium]|nr:DNA-binding transcriptional regulator [Sedimentisphaerales bacterium]